MAVSLMQACDRGANATAKFEVQPAMPPRASVGAAPLFTIELQPPPAPLRELASHRVKVDDPVYLRGKSYEGISVSDVVDRLTPPGARITDDAHLVMVCLDGYRASLTLWLARKGGGILARRDTDAAATWEGLPGSTSVRTPAPFYLVWEPAAAASGTQLPWPYGIVAIEVWLADPANRAKPSRTVNGIGRGYSLFAEKCISCHRINGAGGTLASELNTPVNVTEYWNPLALKQFIVNPGSIRAQSKMPHLTSLTAADIDAIVVYLESMKYEKLQVK